MEQAEQDAMLMEAPMETHNITQYDSGPIHNDGLEAPEDSLENFLEK